MAGASKFTVAPLRFLKSNANEFKAVWTHPLNQRSRRSAVLRWLRWKAAANVALGPTVVPYIGETVLLSEKNSNSVTKCVFYGLQEFNEMGFFLHVLRAGDLFCDVGANAGTFTVLASGVAKANSIAFEPAPSVFRRLSQNVWINNLSDRVELHQVAVGSRADSAFLTTDLNTFNHVVPESRSNTSEVRVETLDTLLAGRAPFALKIDVEGFELEVLRGARKTLGDPQVSVVLLEIAEHLQRYGANRNDVINELERNGFLPYTYDPLSRRLLQRLPQDEEYNFLFIRNADDLLHRILGAPQVAIHGMSL
jgi:FkbM family methyltransferase